MPKLSKHQLAGLECLAAGPGDYFDLARASVRGPTISWLLSQGLIRVDTANGIKTYAITDAGRVELDSTKVVTHA